MIFLSIFIGKIISLLSCLLNIGRGGTWPGEIALILNPYIFTFFTDQVKKGLIIIAGTNGKTTTSKMIKQIMTDSFYSNEKIKIIHNSSGANLLNGLVSAFIKKASLTGEVDVDYAILEVDENTLPQIILNIPASPAGRKNKKLIIVLLNLFRDQLDRYGEVDIIANKWKKALEELSKDSVVILNADDPQIAYLGKNLKNKVVYFGIERKDKFLRKIEHATDSTYCQVCGSKLSYKGVYFSHLGIWFCGKCGNKRPKVKVENYSSSLPGLYNEYNALASLAVGRELCIDEKAIKRSLSNFQPAFGRQEEFVIHDKKIKIFLSKNPAGFNASLRAVLDLKPKVLLLVLNDRIPDGRDVSWIWDVDFEMIPENVQVIVSGDRTYDIALRMKYALLKYQISNIKYQKHKSKIKNIQHLTFNAQQLTVEPNLRKAIHDGLERIRKDEVLYILPTYSAMLEVRKILIGRKIL